jgi:hypothetical protein
VTRTWVRMGATVLGLTVLIGCGNDDGNGGATAADLQARVAGIRELAASRDPELVATELDELRASVEDLRDRGELDDERAAAILEAADVVEAQLGLITTTTTTTAPPVEYEEDDDD